jgi:ParB family chromosome partitioning protein
LAERTISAGHARALLGTPDRTLQEKLVEQIIAEGLTVRAVEEIVRGGAPVAPHEPTYEEIPEELDEEAGTTVGPTGLGVRRTPPKKLPEPGVLELEDLLSTYLNTRVKVDIQNRRGRLVVEFATLEDLERIYRAMVGDGAA